MIPTDTPTPAAARPFCGKPKRQRTDPHFSELELVIMEKLFAAPIRRDWVGCGKPGAVLTMLRGLTARELALIIGRGVGTVRPRLREMERKGAIRDSGCHALQRDRREIVWMAVL